MSCPDWSRFAGAREELEDDPAWQSALAHLDHCSRCWPAALSVEPTLVFRRLPEPEVDATVIEQVRQGVAVLRRSRSFEHPHSRTVRAGWGIAAALLLAASVALSPGARTGVIRDGAATSFGSGQAEAIAVNEPLSFSMPNSRVGQSVAATTSDEAPLIEKMGERGARIYQLRGKGVAVVMIVDRHIDV